MKTVSLHTLSENRTPLMGLAIMFIMLFHCHIFSFGFVGVEFFLILSGIGLTYSENRNHLSYPEYLGRRLRRILPAYLLVFIPYSIFHGKDNDDMFVDFMWETGMTYWYIFLILTLYLAFPFLRKLLKNRDLYWSLVAVSFSVGLIVGCCFKTLDLFVCRLPVMLLSVWIGDAVFNKKRVPVALMLFLAITGLALTWFVIYRMAQLPMHGSSYLVYLLAAVFSLPLLVLLVPFVRLPHVNAILSKMGTVTLELYLLHESIVRPLTKKLLSVFINNPVILQIILIPLSIFLAYLFAWCLHTVIQLASDWIRNKKAQHAA